MRVNSPLPLASAHQVTPSVSTEAIKPTITARACAITPQGVNDAIAVAPHPVGLLGAVVVRKADPAPADPLPP